MSEPICECPGPGFCVRYQIDQTEYAWGVCSGKGGPGDRPCTTEKSERFRRKWRLKVIEKCKHGPPSLPQQTANLTKAMVKHVLDRLRKTPEGELKIREAICLVCEMNTGKENNELGQCKHKACGCYLKQGQILGMGLTVPSKLEIASEKCPLGLWGSV